MVTHRGTMKLQVGSQKLSVTSGWLTEFLRHLMVTHRGSMKLQVGSQKLSVTSGWHTEALIYFRVAQRGSHIPQGGLLDPLRRHTNKINMYSNNQ